MKKMLAFLYIFVAFATSAFSQWESDPSINNPITPTDGSFAILSFQMAQGNGCTYIYYQSFTPDLEHIGNYLQILDANGAKKFAEPGLFLCAEESLTYTSYTDAIWADDDGNAVIAVPDLRVGGYAPSYSLYKVSPEGEHLWTENGTALSNNTPAAGCYLKMLQLPNGDYMFTWMNQDESTVSLRRVSKEGILLGNEYILSEKLCGYPYIVQSDDNNIILVYLERNGNGNPWSRFAWLKAQKFDENLNPLWTNPLTIYTKGFTTPAIYVIVNVESDDNNGALVAWYDGFVNGNREDAYLCRINADGSFAFTSSISEHTNAIRIGGHATYRSFTPKVIAHGNSVWATWKESNSSQEYTRLMLQKYSSDGTEVFAAGGKQIDENTAVANGIDYMSLQKSLNNACIVFYQKNLVSYSDVKNYAHLFDEDGKSVWDNSSPLIFATSPDVRSDLVSGALIENNYWLTLWYDERGDNFHQVFLQRINIDGSLGDNTSNSQDLFTENTFVNKIFTKNQTIFIEGSFNNVKIYDIFGKLIADGNKSAYHIPTKGLYFVVIDNIPQKIVVK